jgi:hypothetical protein
MYVSQLQWDISDFTYKMNVVIVTNISAVSQLSKPSETPHKSPSKSLELAYYLWTLNISISIHT